MTTHSDFKRLKNSKRGYMAQLVVSVVFLFVLGLVFVATYMAQSQINDELQLDTSMDSGALQVSQNQTDSYPGVFDSGINFVAVIIFLVVLALAYAAPNHPLALVAVILVMSALGFASMFISNAWSDFSSDATFSIYVASFPFSSFLLDHFLIYVLVLGFSSLMMYMYSSGGLG